MSPAIAIEGASYVIHGNVDTDTIIKSTRCVTSDPERLAPYCLDALEHAVHFPEHRPWPVVVCDGTFGIGSARIQAPLALRGAGVELVVAREFAPIFFENCLNGALLLPLRGSLARCPRTGDFVRATISADGARIEVAGVGQHLDVSLPHWALRRQSWMDYISARAVAAGGLQRLRDTGL